MAHIVFSTLDTDGVDDAQDAIDICTALNPANIESKASQQFLRGISLSRVKHLLEHASARNLAPVQFASLLQYSGFSLSKPTLGSLQLAKLIYNSQVDVMRDLNRAFKASRIEFVYLKGIGIRSAYPDWMLRPQSDIDILVMKDDLFAAEELLKRVGFKRSYSDMPDETSARAYSNARLEFFTHRGEMVKHSSLGVPVKAEVHFRMPVPPEPYRLCTESMLKRRSVSDFGETQFPTLASADHVLFMCCHLHRHDTQLHSLRIRNDHVLSRVLDIAFYAKRFASEWRLGELASSLREMRVEVPVTYALSLVDKIFPTVLPDEARELSMFVGATDIRYSNFTGNWEPIGRWTTDPVSTLFDSRRYESIRDLEGRLREHPPKIRDPRLVYAFRKASRSRA